MKPTTATSIPVGMGERYDARPVELDRYPITADVLSAAPSAALPARDPDRIQDQAGRLRIRNRSMMSHPLHVHGHTRWMVHCHNAYHAQAGMMTRLDYTT